MQPEFEKLEVPLPRKLPGALPSCTFCHSALKVHLPMSPCYSHQYWYPSPGSLHTAVFGTMPFCALSSSFVTVHILEPDGAPRVCAGDPEVPDEEEEEEEEKKKKNPDKDDPEKEEPDAPPSEE